MEISRAVAAALPRLDLVGVPRLGGTSHRFTLDVLPRWKDSLAERMDQMDDDSGGLVFEIHPEEPVDPVLLGPIFDAVANSPWTGLPPVAFFVHSEEVAEDLLNFGAWKAKGIPAGRRPALQVARADKSGNLTLAIDAQLHGWADKAIPVLWDLPLFSAALLRTPRMGDESAGKKGLQPRLLSDRVSAIEKSGLITPVPHLPHDEVARYVDEHSGFRVWRRPPRLFVSRPCLLRTLAENTLGERLRRSKLARRP